MLLGLQLFATSELPKFLLVAELWHDFRASSRNGRTCRNFGKLRLPLPKSFNGEPSNWEGWSWNFKSYLAIFQPDSVDFWARSETSNTEILDAYFTAEEAAGVRVFSKKLHYFLANLCTGSARLLVRQNEAGNGFETWCRLSQRFSLPDATRHVSLWLGFLSGSSALQFQNLFFRHVQAPSCRTPPLVAAKWRPIFLAAFLTIFWDHLQLFFLDHLQLFCWSICCYFCSCSFFFGTFAAIFLHLQFFLDHVHHFWKEPLQLCFFAFAISPLLLHSFAFAFFFGVRSLCVGKMSQFSDFCLQLVYGY